MKQNDDILYLVGSGSITEISQYLTNKGGGLGTFLVFLLQEKSNPEPGLSEQEDQEGGSTFGCSASCLSCCCVEHGSVMVRH